MVIDEGKKNWGVWSIHECHGMNVSWLALHTGGVGLILH